MKFPTLFRKPKPHPVKPLFDPLNPETPFVVIGDVHGRIDLLETLTARLPRDQTIICVGDLVDRGDHSAEVLQFVKNHPNMSTLLGNHEAMMLSFIDNPKANGARWIRNGGLQTLASFGIAGVTETSGEASLQRARDALYDAMGTDLLRWLTKLDYIAWSGNVAVVHAGSDPNKSLEEQSPETFIWGHPEFRRKPRTDGFWIVHGHTIVDEPKTRDGRISIDTGAYATGRLTAALFSSSGVEFLTT